MWYKGYFIQSDFMSMVVFKKNVGAIYRCWTVQQAKYFIDNKCLILK
jgi:hypothetical protein